MKLLAYCKTYITTHHCGIKSSDLNILYILMIILLIMSIIFIGINYFGKDYHGISYLPPMDLIYALPIVFILNYIAYHYLNEIPFWGFLTWSYTTFLILGVVGGLLANGIQYTPFPYIDPYLISFDSWFHFSSIGLLVFTHNHPTLHFIFRISYDLIVFQLFIIAIFLPLFKTQGKSVVIFFSALCISWIIGTTCYYFFPSVAPAHYFNSPYFTAAQHNTYLKFYEIHHYLPISSGGGGMIAFPSFHVIWATLFIYAYRKIKWLFYIILIVNILGILSTMFLGWHYLADVISGIGLAIFSIIVAEWLFNRNSDILNANDF